MHRVLRTVQVAVRGPNRSCTIAPEATEGGTHPRVENNCGSTSYMTTRHDWEVVSCSRENMHVWVCHQFDQCSGSGSVTSRMHAEEWLWPVDLLSALHRCLEWTAVFESAIASARAQCCAAQHQDQWGLSDAELQQALASCPSKYAGDTHGNELCTYALCGVQA